MEIICICSSEKLQYEKEWRKTGRCMKSQDHGGVNNVYKLEMKQLENRENLTKYSPGDEIKSTSKELT